jgi:hypothetical protein
VLVRATERSVVISKEKVQQVLKEILHPSKKKPNPKDIIVSDPIKKVITSNILMVALSQLSLW